MSYGNLHKRLFIVGMVPPNLISSLTTRWTASLAHHYETMNQLAGFGEETLRRAEYNAVLIGEGVTPDNRRQILAAIDERPLLPTIAVITSETSYDAWVPVPPGSPIEAVAEALKLTPRRDPANIVIISSTKGGVGKSSTATNLAVTLASMEKEDGTPYRVALIDDDRTTRSIRTMMGVDESAPTTADLVSAVNAAQGVVTREMVEKHLVEAFGVSCLVGPHTIITDFPIEVETARDVLAIMGIELGYDYIIIDSPPDFINTSSFTFGILTRSEALPRQPLILVPIVPEKLLLRSVDDTISSLTHFQQPMHNILPLINCMRSSHDPEKIRGTNVLWRDPLGIIPYTTLAEYVGENRRPVVAEKPETAVQQVTRKYFLGQTTVRDIRSAYQVLSDNLVTMAKERSNGHVV